MVFGPDGVGKSDLIRLAQSKGIPAYDVEAFGHNYEDRKKGFKVLESMEKSDYILFGAADLKLADINPFMKTVLLLPPNYDQLIEKSDQYDYVLDDVNVNFSLLKDILIKTNCPKEYLF